MIRAIVRRIRMLLGWSTHEEKAMLARSNKLARENYGKSGVL